MSQLVICPGNHNTLFWMHNEICKQIYDTNIKCKHISTAVCRQYITHQFCTLVEYFNISDKKHSIQCKHTCIALFTCRLKNQSNHQ